MSHESVSRRFVRSIGAMASSTAACTRTPTRTRSIWAPTSWMQAGAMSLAVLVLQLDCANGYVLPATHGMTHALPNAGLHRCDAHSALLMSLIEEPQLQLVRMQCPAGVGSGVWSELLLESGALYVSISDGDRDTPSEVPIFATHPEGSGVAVFETWDGLLQASHLWSNSTLEAGFALETDVEATLLFAAATMGLAETPRFSIESVAPRDWVTHVQSNWPPVDIADCLRIKFPWHEADDDDLPALTVQPGMAFGTGEHATTQLCCREIKQMVETPQLKGCSVLDYGSGSGVLAFAAILFGASRAVGVEIDPDAVRVSIANAEANSLGSQFAAYLPGFEAEEDKQPFPLVVANILAGTLVELAPLITQRVAPQGTLLLSGIWGEEQADGVMRAYGEHGFTFLDTVWQDGWALVRAVRTGSMDA